MNTDSDYGNCSQNNNVALIIKAYTLRKHQYFIRVNPWLKKESQSKAREPSKKPKNGVKAIHLQFCL